MNFDVSVLEALVLGQSEKSASHLTTLVLKPTKKSPDKTRIMKKSFA